MTRAPSARILVLHEALSDYRAEFLQRVRQAAAAHGIAVSVVHGRAPGPRGDRLNTGFLPEAYVIRNRYLRVPGLPQPLVWQPVLRRCLASDLVVVEQANRMLINYLLLVAQKMGRLKVAFWGHGRNFQSPPSALPERLKKLLLRSPHWWFAYTHLTAAYLERHGVPPSRITVVGNTIDVMSLRARIEKKRRISGGPTAPACLFLGGLYESKRLRFLFHAADRIAAIVPGFRLHIAGTGEQKHLVEAFVASRPWATYFGAVQSERKAELLASAQLLLMPGLVGLVLLDAFAAGVPLVTTADAPHSPEIAYLENGVNGLMLPPGADPESYADAVAQLLQDSALREKLSTGARLAAFSHTLDDAVQRFVRGLLSALDRQPSPHDRALDLSWS